jgi:hypothetical protein
MPGFLAGTISDAYAQHSRHVTIPARLWLYVLLFIGFVIFLLVLPVVWGAVSEAASTAAEKAAPGTFFLGLGILFLGLVAGIEILDIVGASLAGLVVISVIVDNYLGLRSAAAVYVRGGSGGRRLDGLVRVSGGRTAGRCSRASSASLTAVSSWVSRSAAQSSGDMMTSTSGSTP